MPPASFSVRAIAAGFFILAAQQAGAQSVTGFWTKTIKVTVGGPAGSDADNYARLVAKYLGRHIPGSPAVVVADMLGSGGHEAAGYIYAGAPADGTAIGAVPPEVITAPLWFGFGRIPHDPSKLIYLGSAASESTNCFVASDAPVRNLRDTFVREVTMAAEADGGPTRDGPALLNAILGTKFRVTATYPDIGAILTGIEKGEIEGACGLTWSSISSRHPDWLPKGVLRGLVQESVTGSRLATRLGIPLAADFVASVEDREVLARVYAQQEFGRPFILPPATPPPQTAILRQGFIAALQDKGLLAEARQRSIAIEPLSGEAVTKLVASLYGMPAPLVDRIRAALAGGSPH